MFRKRKQWQKCNKMKKCWHKQNNKQRNIEKKEKLCKSIIIINKTWTTSKNTKTNKGEKKNPKNFVKKCIQNVVTNKYKETLIRRKQSFTCSKDEKWNMKTRRQVDKPWEGGALQKQCHVILTSSALGIVSRIVWCFRESIAKGSKKHKDSARIWFLKDSCDKLAFQPSRAKVNQTYYLLPTYLQNLFSLPIVYLQNLFFARWISEMPSVNLGGEMEFIRKWSVKRFQVDGVLVVIDSLRPISGCKVGFRV
jgi:hypothetical protein